MTDDAGGDQEPRIYLVHSSIAPDRLRQIDGVLDHQELVEGLAFVESELSRSRLYHEVKWAGSAGTPLMVVELTVRPKLMGMASGSASWISDRLPDR